MILQIHTWDIIKQLIGNSVTKENILRVAERMYFQENYELDPEEDFYCFIYEAQVKEAIVQSARVLADSIEGKNLKYLVNSYLSTNPESVSLPSEVVAEIKQNIANNPEELGELEDFTDKLEELKIMNDNLGEAKKNSDHKVYFEYMMATQADGINLANNAPVLKEDIEKLDKIIDELQIVADKKYDQMKNLHGQLKEIRILPPGVIKSLMPATPLRILLAMLERTRRVASYFLSNLEVNKLEEDPKLERYINGLSDDDTNEEDEDYYEEDYTDYDEKDGRNSAIISQETNENGSASPL